VPTAVALYESCYIKSYWRIDLLKLCVDTAIRKVILENSALLVRIGRDSHCEDLQDDSGSIPYRWRLSSFRHVRAGPELYTYPCFTDAGGSLSVKIAVRM
jgi:hypothetical protein